MQWSHSSLKVFDELKNLPYTGLGWCWDTFLLIDLSWWFSYNNFSRNYALQNFCRYCVCLNGIITYSFLCTSACFLLTTDKLFGTLSAYRALVWLIFHLYELPKDLLLELVLYRHTFVINGSWWLSLKKGWTMFGWEQQSPVFHGERLSLYFWVSYGV